MDTSFNSFLATRKQSDELKNINNDNIQSKLQQISEGDITDGGTRTNKDGKQNKQRKYIGHGRVSKKPRFLSG